MFKKMSIEKQNLLRNTGKLSFVKSPPNINLFTEDGDLYHIIYESSTTSFPIYVFRTKIRMTDRLIILSDITTVSYSGNINEETEHFFFGWFLEELQKWATEQNRERVLVNTNIKHCTEWFVEYGYDVRQRTLPGFSGGYRGLKSIAKAKGGNSA